MASIYRTYRPDKFSAVMGQQHVTEALTSAVTHDKLTHAYLFQGPRGTGKTTCARILAKRVNCLKPKKDEPCGVCNSCKSFAQGNNLDIIEIDAASNRGIDDVRALRETVSTSPTIGKYKIFIIDEVHMLTNEASSALLKTLEEPVKHVIFILATTEIHKVLPTILSRCQVFRFRRASREEMTRRLKWIVKMEKRSSENNVYDFIVDRSDGCYRDGETLLGQLLTLQEGKLKLDDLSDLMGLPDLKELELFLGALIKGESAPALEALDKIFNVGVDPEQFLKEAVRVARDETVKLATAENDVKNFAKIEGAVTQLPIIMRALLQAIQDLAYVPEPLVAVQLAVVTVCDKKGKPVVKQKESDGGNKQSLDSEGDHQKSAQDESSKSRVAQKDISTLTVEKISAIWDKLIDGIKTDNPVASTFLRAVQPIEVNSNSIILRAQYSLHQKFLETPKNKKLIEGKLGELLNTTVSVKPRMDESEKTDNLSVTDKRQNREKDFYKDAKEVFS